MECKIGRYQHYKGPYYQVIDVVRHSETEQYMVLYKPLYNDNNKEHDGDDKQQLWVRPYDMFFEEIEVMGEPMARFTFVGD